MKHKMSKKVLCLCMVAVLAVGLAAPTFADTAFNTPKSGSLLPFVVTHNVARDSDHAYHFRRESSYGGTHTILNLSTSSDTVPSGTKVTLWEATGHSSQEWFLEWNGTINNDNEQQVFIHPNKNRALVLQALRSYVGSTCNVLPSAGNNYNDYNITMLYGDPNAIHPYVKLRLPPRSNHAYEVFVTAHGLGADCTWNYADGNQGWYRIDGPSY